MRLEMVKGCTTCPFTNDGLLVCQHPEYKDQYRQRPDKPTNAFKRAVCPLKRETVTVLWTGDRDEL